MARIRIVRHGEPAAMWGAHPDPGLSALGLGQARAVAQSLGGASALVTSPLARCRETAAPSEAAFGIVARIEPAVAEIPSPAGLSDTRGWLQGVMGGRWSEQDPALRAWRDAVLAALSSLPDGCVVFSHFVAINVAVGAATGRDEATVFRPGHCSVTEIEVDHDGMRLLSLGSEAASIVLA